MTFEEKRKELLIKFCEKYGKTINFVFPGCEITDSCLGIPRTTTFGTLHEAVLYATGFGDRDQEGAHGCASVLEGISNGHNEPTDDDKVVGDDRVVEIITVFDHNSACVYGIKIKGDTENCKKFMRHSPGEDWHIFWKESSAKELEDTVARRCSLYQMDFSRTEVGDYKIIDDNLQKTWLFTDIFSAYCWTDGFLECRRLDHRLARDDDEIM